MTERAVNFLKTDLDRARAAFDAACTSTDITREQYDAARSAYMEANKAFYEAIAATGYTHFSGPAETTQPKETT
jgi:hypothetical protein